MSQQVRLIAFVVMGVIIIAGLAAGVWVSGITYWNGGPEFTGESVVTDDGRISRGAHVQMVRCGAKWDDIEPLITQAQNAGSIVSDAVITRPNGSVARAFSITLESLNSTTLRLSCIRLRF